MTVAVTANDFLAFAEHLADAAGAAIRPHFRTPITIDDKEDRTPVTAADRAAEQVMRDLVTRHHPNHGMIGEEFGSLRPDARLVWVIDPIDGTKSFISGVPLFGTLIALLAEGRPILGIIDQPILGERWIGAQGQATTFNGRPVKSRACTKLENASLHATSPHNFNAPDARAFAKLTARAKRPLYGWDCYAYAQLASGFIDLVVESGLKPFDYLAIVPVVEGAGGLMTDWAGAALGLASDGRVIAAGDARLHAEVLKTLNS